MSQGCEGGKEERAAFQTGIKRLCKGQNFFLRGGGGGWVCRRFRRGLQLQRIISGKFRI
jgi:hypothetical protein